MLADKLRNHLEIRPQRSRGSARVIVHQKNAFSRLEDLYQEGCAKVRLPKTYNPKMIEAVMINTAGGITGGDKLSWQFTSKSGSFLTITSQACERIYRSSQDIAEIDVSLKAEAGSRVCWLPQETILFNQCAVRRKINVDMEGDARILMVEPIIFGRKAMGEKFQQGYFKDDWQIRHEGKLVHVESTKLQDDIDQIVHNRAVFSGQIAIATILLLAPKGMTELQTKLSATRANLGDSDGASFWEVGSTGKLLARLIAKDGYELRKRLIPLISLLNDEAPLPKSWAL